MEHRITWFSIFDYTKKIAEYCKDKNFDCIMAVARGGSIIGTLLSYQLNLPIRYVGISSYNGDKKTDEMKFTQHAEIGDYIDLILQNGEAIKCIVADIKDPRHTDVSNVFTIVGKNKNTICCFGNTIRVFYCNNRDYPVYF